MLSFVTSMSTPLASYHSAARGRAAAILAAVISVAMLGLALSFLFQKIVGLSFDVVFAQLGSISISAWFASIIFAIGSYTVHSVFDVAASRYVDRPMPYRRSALISFLARAIGNNVVITGHSGTSLRRRMYSRSGLPASEITRVVVLIRATVVIGASVLLGLVLVLLPSTKVSPDGPAGLTALAGGALLAIPLACLVIAFLRRAPLRIGIWNVDLPRPKVALALLGAAFVDMLFAAATLYVLLAPFPGIALPSFMGIYLLARAAGVVSRVPGGIGVFEAVLFGLLPGVAPGVLLGAVIAYRCIYYVAPIAIALILIIRAQLRESAWKSRVPDANGTGWLSDVAPQALGTLAFLAGVVLLVSGVSPTAGSRVAFIAGSLPLPVLELAPLCGSVAGALLLILSQGLFRRLHAAYLGALSVLLIGIVSSLLNGLNYEVALVIAVIAIALDLLQSQFPRRGAIDAEHFPAAWIAAIVMAIGFALWVGLVSHAPTGYSRELWSRFAVDAEAPRSLRSAAAALIVVIAFSVWVLVRRVTESSLSSVTSDSPENVHRALAETSQPSANLALLGDKRLLWSHDKRAFLMYQASGDSWVAFANPVGPPAYRDELSWAFLDLVNKHHGRAVFFKLGEDRQSMYIDMGLALSKIGEEARVWLREFSLESNRHSSLREAVNAVRECGAELEIVAKESVPSIMVELRRVSDSWLADKCTNEKRFSIGSFSEEYIANFDCAVVRINGVIVAFANLWPAAAGKEIAVDLMRYDPSAPRGIMDYLFAETMLWARNTSHQWFNLGMASCEASERQALEPLWQKLDNVICGHGDNFYDMKGLRAFKDKFNPSWRPCYLACPPVWRQLPQALLETSRMISGGVAGMFVKA